MPTLKTMGPPDLSRKYPLQRLPRRTFLTGALAAAAALAARPLPAAAAPRNPICAFVKFVQALSFEALAEQIAQMGFNGIEATVRPGGQIDPERAGEELPQLVEALHKHGLEVTIMTTNITRADQPHAERVLRAAALLGITHYRMGYYRYDLNQPVSEQLEQVKPVVRDLAALTHDLGLTALYQNHAGAQYVGGTVWDLVRLLEDIPPHDTAIAFDIRHATAEAGYSWPVLFNVARPHLGAVFMKDFAWKDGQVENVPLGAGRVDKRFCEMVKQAGFSGPISLHVEYLEEAGLDPNLAALKTDLATLRNWLGYSP